MKPKRVSVSSLFAPGQFQLIRLENALIQAWDKKFQNAGDGHGEDHAGQAGKVASEQHDNQCLQNVEAQRFTDQCGTGRAVQ